jgi:hypothetical protein
VRRLKASRRYCFQCPERVGRDHPAVEEDEGHAASSLDVVNVDAVGANGLGFGFHAPHPMGNAGSDHEAFASFIDHQAIRPRRGEFRVRRAPMTMPPRKILLPLVNESVEFTLVGTGLLL